jgi:osmotically-inducible protein OsmY
MSHVRVERARARARARFASLMLAAGVLFAGCGESEEAKIAKLTGELGKLRQSVVETRAAVAEREAAVKAANDALAKSRGELRDSEARIATIEKELGQHATDPVLFRMVQKQLLDDDDLEDVAISATVQHGVVTLAGIVSNQKLRERAVKLAESVPGVVSVQDRIQVAPAEASGD